MAYCLGYQCINVLGGHGNARKRETIDGRSVSDEHYSISGEAMNLALSGRVEVKI